jgi:hypothetical protein
MFSPWITPSNWTLLESIPIKMHFAKRQARQRAPNAVDLKRYNINDVVVFLTARAPD